jgi:hypothetical protein
METVIIWATGTVLVGFGMFLWGMLSGSEREKAHTDGAWVDGFRDGWEACQKFEQDMNSVWTLTGKNL